MFNLFLVVWFAGSFVGGLVVLAWNLDELPTAIGLPLLIWTLGGLVVGGFWAAHEDNKNSKKGGE